jgi:hypothetical protein
LKKKEGWRWDKLEGDGAQSSVKQFNPSVFLFLFSSIHQNLWFVSVTNPFIKDIFNTGKVSARVHSSCAHLCKPSDQCKHGDKIKMMIMMMSFVEAFALENTDLALRLVFMVMISI